MCNDEESEEFLKLEKEYMKLLPEWATGHNTNKELKKGTQLQTRDGRQRGNARITEIITLNGYNGEAYKAITDAGSTMTLSEAEVHSLFYIGPYFIEPVR